MSDVFMLLFWCVFACVLVFALGLLGPPAVHFGPLRVFIFKARVRQRVLLHLNSLKLKALEA